MTPVFNFTYMPKKPRIFLESHNLKNQFSGFGQFNYWLIKNMAELNTDYELIATAKKRNAIQDFKNVKFKQYYSLSRYKQFYPRKKYDLWHSLNQNTRTEPYHDLPYILTVHDLIILDHKDREHRNRFEKLMLQKIGRSNAITYISEYVKEQTNQHFEIPDHVIQKVIYNGNPAISSGLYQKQLSIDKNEEPFLFSIGQFLERKNFHALLPMLKKLENFKLIIAGNADKPYGEFIKKEIENHGLNGRVKLVGKISEEEKHSYLQKCAAFVFPSLAEGFGLPVIEAMAYGKPVFIAKNSSLPEIGSDIAFYWENFDPEHMLEVFENGMNLYDANRKDMSEKLVHRANYFNWQRTAKEYLELYSEIIK